MKRKAFLIILLICFVSCEPLDEPSNNFDYSIISNLITNSNEQYIYVYNTIAINDNSWNANGNPSFAKYLVGNANIFITDYNNISHEFTLLNDVDDPKYIANFNIVPKNYYKINLTIGDYKIIGETYSPSDFSILQPLPGEVFYLKDKKIEIQILWSKATDSFGYIVNIFEKHSRGFDLENSFLSQDTSFIYIKKESISSEVITNKIFKIEVLAFDKNFYEHIIKNIPSAGIEGAYGYFSSSVSKTVTVNVEK